MKASKRVEALVRVDEVGWSKMKALACIYFHRALAKRKENENSR